MKKRSGGHGLLRKERLQIRLSADELEAIDSFRFAYRLPTRGAAVRELLRRGSAARKGRVRYNPDVKSVEYGVLKSPKGGSVKRTP